MAKKRRIVSQKFYNSQTLHKEREYGFFWYAGLWKLIRPLLIFSISLVVCAGLVVSAGNMLYEEFLMPVAPDDNTEITFRIKSGSSVTKISNNLYDQGFIRNKGIFKILVMFQGVTNKISYGDYLLSRDMTPGEIISVLTSGTQITERTITIVPGWTVTVNDPPITVSADSEDCYLFVRIAENIGDLAPGAEFKQYLFYDAAEGWTQGNGFEIPADVYYRTVPRSINPQVFDIIKNHEVQVSGDITKAMLENLQTIGAVLPSLTYTAYAVQMNSSNTTTFTPEEAWAIAAAETGNQ